MEKRSEGKTQHAAKLLRRKKFLLVAPVIMLPFVLLLLWTFGLIGGATSDQSSKDSFGFNLNLPNAAPSKDSNWNKLKYYEQAEKDSAKLKLLLKSDPYRRYELEAENIKSGGHLYDPYPSDESDQNEQRVYKKINALNHELESASKRERVVEPVHSESKVGSGEVERLERMMQSMQYGKGREEDPEVTQLNQMLERILDIQNPERVQEKLRVRSEQSKREVFAIEKPGDDFISVLKPKKDFAAQLADYKMDSVPEAMQTFMSGNRFYSLQETVAETSLRRAVAAAVPETQTLVNGSTVKLRLLEDILISGVKIPKDHFIYGQAALNGERLQIMISSIAYHHYLLPVALVVYDQKDGLPGINVPGAIVRDVVKKSTNQSMQDLSSAVTLNPSIGAQVVSAGLQTAQSLVGKRTKLIRVTVEAGYPVLLKNDNVK